MCDNDSRVFRVSQWYLSFEKKNLFRVYITTFTKSSLSKKPEMARSYYACNVINGKYVYFRIKIISF